MTDELNVKQWTDKMAGVQKERILGYREVKACRLCDSLMIRPVLDLGETPLANELDGTQLFPLVVMRCDDCEHHQLSIAVSPERLWGPKYPYQSGTSPVFREHLEKLADEVAELKPGGRVLEIGSNDGTLVRMLAARGCTVSGIDPSGPNEQTETVRLWPSSWPPPYGIGAYRSKCDVILALNVFAHVDDLHSFTSAVKEALAPDGVFILEVGYLPTMIERGVFDTIYAEHMSYHHVAPLMSFFGRHGLRAYKATLSESQGGSVRLYVKQGDGQKSLLFFEGAPDITKLCEHITLTKAGLQVALETRESIAGYGCPAKFTTMQYVTGVGRKIGYTFDDNPLKVGKFAPGGHVRIEPTSRLLELNPDTLILFSWNFASEIIPRLRAMGYRGRIVTPLPEVTIDEV